MWVKIIYTAVAIAYAAGAYWLLDDYCKSEPFAAMCASGAGRSW